MRPMWHIAGRLGNQMFQMAYLYAQQLEGNIPDIYLQNESYFENHRNEIKRLYGDNIGYIPWIAIHVRRGDYVNNPFYVDLFKDGYYERAMKEFPGCKFMVFSDDIEWCTNQALFEGCAFSKEPDEVEDLNNMASCIGHIVANSSFSWWAAYLSPHGGKVVAPSKWFTDGVKRISLLNTWKTV